MVEAAYLYFGSLMQSILSVFPLFGVTVFRVNEAICFLDIVL